MSNTPAATLTLKLHADSGYETEESCRVTADPVTKADEAKPHEHLIPD